MRLAAKLVLGIVLGMAIALTVDALLQVRRESALFETDMQRDQRLLGRALREAVEAAWAHGGEPAARALVGRVGRAESGMGVRWIPSAAPGGLPAEVADRLARGEEASLIAPRDARGGSVTTYVPLAPSMGPSGILELSESLAEERRFTHATMTKALGLAGATALLCGALATGLGFLLVGRPVHRLVEQARRVGAGDLSGRIAPGPRDEIADLAHEMNLMCDRLDGAQRRTAEAVAARIAALEQLRHADRLRTVGTLASGIAHELGTPLNVAMGRGKMVATGEASGGLAAECGRIVVEQCERMTRIIRQLLDFARRREPRAALEDLRVVASRTAALLAPLAARRGVEISLALGDAPAPARVDAALIQQAIANLVVNAIDAMPDGGRLEIGLSRGPGRATQAGGDAEGDAWRLSVEDHGGGMPPEVLARVFEPFFTTKDVGEGTGLGLSVTHGIVEEHGGRIVARSAVGAGSRFEIFLPAGNPA